MRVHPTSPKEMARSLWTHRSLIFSLARREVLGRYRGSVIGVLWSVIVPLFMLCIYTFVFSVIFKARWGEGNGSKTEFAVILFVGLIVFNVFSECIGRAPGLVVGNPNYVRKIVFPLEILPWVAMASALFQAAVSLGVWFVAYFMVFGAPPLTIFLFPLVLVPFVFFVMGVSWLIASLGVYLRDVSQVVGIAVTTLFFLSPVFYPISALPESFRPLFNLNPVTPAIEQARNVMVFGVAPDVRVWLVYLAASLLIAWLGFAWFQKTRKGFADVL